MVFSFKLREIECYRDTKKIGLSMDSFSLTTHDLRAVEIAIDTARNFLETHDLSPRDIIGLGNALYALERLPQVTIGAFCCFGLMYRYSSEDSGEMR